MAAEEQVFKPLMLIGYAALLTTDVNRVPRKSFLALEKIRQESEADVRMVSYSHHSVDALSRELLDSGVISDHLMHANYVHIVGSEGQPNLSAMNFLLDSLQEQIGFLSGKNAPVIFIGQGKSDFYLATAVANRGVKVEYISVGYSEPRECRRLASVCQFERLGTKACLDSVFQLVASVREKIANKNQAGCSC